MANNHIERKVAHSFRLVRMDVARINQALKNISERLGILESRSGPSESHSVIIPVSSLKSKKGKRRKRK